MIQLFSIFSKAYFHRVAMDANWNYFCYKFQKNNNLPLDLYNEDLLSNMQKETTNFPTIKSYSHNNWTASIGIINYLKQAIFL